LAVGLPYPLQFDTNEKSEWNGKMQFENLANDKGLATKKLEAYWVKLGMNCLQGIDIHGSSVYGLCFEQIRPTVAQLVPHL